MTHDQQVTVARGRACVQLIEAAEVLLAGEFEPERRRTLQQARQIGVAQLRSLVGELPPHVTAQILVASEKLIGPAGDVSEN